MIAIQVGRGTLPRDPNAPTSGQGQWQKDVIGVNAFQLIPGKLDAAERRARLALDARRRSRTRRCAANVTRAQITFDQEDRGFGKAVALLGGCRS